MKHPPKEVEKMLLRPSWFILPADSKVMQNPMHLSGIGQAYAESLRQSGQVDRDGAQTLLTSRGFTPHQVQFDRLFIWCGEDDREVPVVPLRLIAPQLPRFTTDFYSAEGHFSRIVNFIEGILKALK
jgi:hypothetical protein